CGRMQGPAGSKTTAQLRGILEDRLPEFGLSHEHGTFYAHIIPSLTAETLRRFTYCGDGWAMIGDAAGLVDAITGEGLYYALRSAELFTQVMLKEGPQTYACLAALEIVPELEIAAGIAERFYSGEWLGAAVIERMIGLTA